MASGLKNFLDKLRNKPKQEKEGIISICVIIIMIFLIILWIKTLGNNKKETENEPSWFSGFSTELQRGLSGLRGEVKQNIENIKTNAPQQDKNKKIEENNMDKKNSEEEIKEKPQENEKPSLPTED